MSTMHELFDGSEAHLLGALLNTVDEYTALGDAFLAGLAAGKEITLIADMDADAELCRRIGDDTRTPD